MSSMPPCGMERTYAGQVLGEVAMKLRMRPGPIAFAEERKGRATVSKWCARGVCVERKRTTLTTWCGKRTSGVDLHLAPRPR
jgi:hypothetical protein